MTRPRYRHPQDGALQEEHWHRDGDGTLKSFPAHGDTQVPGNQPRTETRPALRKCTVAAERGRVRTGLKTAIQHDYLRALGVRDARVRARLIELAEAEASRRTVQGAATAQIRGMVARQAASALGLPRPADARSEARAIVSYFASPPARQPRMPMDPQTTHMTGPLADDGASRPVLVPTETPGSMPVQPLRAAQRPSVRTSILERLGMIVGKAG